jgi:hypothetical protein
MTEQHSPPRPPEDDHIPSTRHGILETLAAGGEYCASTEYRERAVDLAQRLRSGENIPEIEKATALGIPWGAFVTLRLIQLARRDGSMANLHEDDDETKIILAVQIIAGMAEFRRGDGRLLAAIDVAQVDAYLDQFGKWTLQ